MTRGAHLRTWAPGGPSRVEVAGKIPSGQGMCPNAQHHRTGYLPGVHLCLSRFTKVAKLPGGVEDRTVKVSPSPGSSSCSLFRGLLCNLFMLIT